MRGSERIIGPRALGWPGNSKGPAASALQHSLHKQEHHCVSAAVTSWFSSKIQYFCEQTGSTDNAKNELAEYFRLTNKPTSFEDTEQLKWWYMRRNKFPRLYRLARDMLCIPGKSLSSIDIYSSDIFPQGLLLQSSVSFQVDVTSLCFAALDSRSKHSDLNVR
jgi:hypothetical protein